VQNPIDVPYLNIELPFYEEAVRVRIEVDGTLFDTIPLPSGPAPSLTLFKPTSVEEVQDFLEITWNTTSDVDDVDTLEYRVEYSNDDGQTWQVIAASANGQSLRADLRSLPGSNNQSHVRVHAFGSQGTATSVSEAFSVPMKSPELLITKPYLGALTAISVVSDDGPFMLAARAVDAEDGNLSGAVQWSSDIAGDLGSGSELSVPLGVGSHVITAQVADSDGQVAASSFTLRVRDSLLLNVDSDSDGISDLYDNCLFEINTEQRDTDDDGYGNLCDPDFDNGGNVDFADLAYLKSKFFPGCGYGS
jgi:hypothetical protein